jgi:hypothetical protein
LNNSGREAKKKEEHMKLDEFSKLLEKGIKRSGIGKRYIDAAFGILPSKQGKKLSLFGFLMALIYWLARTYDVSLKSIESMPAQVDKYIKKNPESFLSQISKSIGFEKNEARAKAICRILMRDFLMAAAGKKAKISENDLLSRTVYSAIEIFHVNVYVHQSLAYFMYMGTREKFCYKQSIAYKNDELKYEYDEIFEALALCLLLLNQKEAL